MQTYQPQKLPNGRAWGKQRCSHYKTKKKLLKEIMKPLVNSFIPALQADMVTCISHHTQTLEQFVTFFVSDRFAFLQQNHELVIIMLQQLLCDSRLRTQIVRQLRRSTRLSAMQQNLITLQPSLKVDRFLKTVLPLILGYFATRFLLQPAASYDEETDLKNLSNQVFAALTCTQ